jgi:glycosyltransferase involved in cell wall biosynthesis
VTRRILLLITDLEIGGTPTVVRELATRLNAPPGVVVEVACLSAAGPVARQLHERHVAVHPLDARGAIHFPRTVGRLSRLVRELRFDTVFSFLMHANVVASVAAGRWGDNVRFLQSIQTTQPWPRWHWWLQSWAHERAERVVVPSNSVAAAAREWADVPREKVVIIPNAVDLPLATPQRPEPRSPFRIGFIGRLHPVKRVPDLLRAVAMLPANYARLDVYGDGPARGEIESMVATLKLHDRVTLHGTVAGSEQALGSIDVLVLPSEAEGMPVVPLEAMAAGVPVVATDVPGTRDVVTHERTGLLVPAGDAHALSQAIRHILNDASLRQRITEAGRQEVAARFSWPAVLEQYRDLLRI